MSETVYQEFIQELKVLTIPQLEQTKNIIINEIKKKEERYLTNNQKKPNCPHCSSSISKRNGYDAKKRERYLCGNSKCNKTFTNQTKNILSGSKKFQNYLYQMVEYTLDGLTIRTISDKIQIPLNTVWTWRTKILNMIGELIDEENFLSKEVYSDETYIKINCKGTKPHKMPRKSYETQKKVVAQRELLCILTAIDNTKRVIFKIDGVARLTREKIDKFIKPLILPGTTLITDGENNYIGFSWENDIIHQPISQTTHKSRLGYSLGPINSTHSAFKHYLKKYRGVSSKRLKGYINLFIFQFMMKRILSQVEMQDYLLRTILNLKIDITDQEIKETKFPIDIENIFKKLKSEGKLK